MDALLVLGLVPGTDIQITFEMWLAAAGLVTGSIYLIRKITTLVKRPVYASGMFDDPTTTSDQTA